MKRTESFEISRRHLFELAGLSAGASLIAPHTLFAEAAQPPSSRNSFDALKQIDAGV